MKCRGIINLSDAECHLVLPSFGLFQAHFLKTVFLKLFQLSRAKWTHFIEQNCSTETASYVQYTVYCSPFIGHSS